MKTKMNLAIPQPCKENWDRMTMGQKGKFCISCQKNVFDFTTSTDREIIKAYNQNPKLCGRFTSAQLNRDLVLPKEKNSLWMIIFASIITFLGVGNQAASAREIVKTEQTDKKLIPDSTSIKPKKEIKKYTGIVYDENNTSLPGVYISIKGTKIKTSSDFSGNFSIKAKKGKVLVFTFIGYKNVEVKLKNDATLKVQMKELEQGLLGEVVIIKYEVD